MAKPVKGSNIGSVTPSMGSGIFDRISRLSNPQSQLLDDKGNVILSSEDMRPETELDILKRYNPRQGILQALDPFSQMYQGKGGFIPRGFGLKKMTGDRDTIGGELLQGAGNVALDALEGLRIAGGIPVAGVASIGNMLGSESDSAYNKRIQQLKGVLDNQSRMQQSQTSPTTFGDDSIVGGVNYQQTPTPDVDDDIIRQQILDAQAMSADNPLGVSVNEITGEITPAGVMDDGTMPGSGAPDVLGLITDSINSDKKKSTDSLPSSPETDKEPEDQMFAGKADSSPPSEIEGANTATKKATVTALDSVLKQVRPDAKPKDYDDYMKEFSDLTGLDVSGQPDNSQALMAFGLALMQNKAGKGFNVGEMLSATGKAGEAAMPALAAARKEAKTTRIKAAEFAISRKDKDEAAALNRTHYYAIPKGEGGDSAILQNLGKAQSVRLNGQELNSFIGTNSDYELIPAKSYLDIVTESAKPTDLGKPYLTTLQKTPLFEGASDFFTVNVQVADGNYKGERRSDLVKEDIGVLEARFQSAEKELNIQEKEFAELTRLVQSGVTTGDAIGSVVTSFGKRFGIGVGRGATNLQKAQYLLKKMAVKNTKDILGEAGKTISDGDRALVKDIVGDIDSIMGADEDELMNRIEQVYSMVVSKGRRNLDAGYRSLSEKGINIGPYDSSRQSNSSLNEDDQAELERLRKAQGVGA